MDPMNDAALEREIERALAVDPSPEFLVRVRDARSPTSQRRRRVDSGGCSRAWQRRLSQRPSSRSSCSGPSSVSSPQPDC